MARRERIYERVLRRVVDDEVRREIEAMFQRKRGEVPVPLGFQWMHSGNGFRIEAPLAVFLVEYTTELITVDAELGLVARMMITPHHRAEMVRSIESMAQELGI